MEELAKVLEGGADVDLKAGEGGFEPSKIPAIVRSVLKKRDKVGDAHHVNAAFESRGIMHE